MKFPAYFYSLFSLPLVLFAGVVGYLLFTDHKIIRVIIVGCLCLYFVLWGVYKHAALGSYSSRRVWEYVLVSLLGLALVLFLLYYD